MPDLSHLFASEVPNPSQGVGDEMKPLTPNEGGWYKQPDSNFYVHQKNGITEREDGALYNGKQWVWREGKEEVPAPSVPEDKKTFMHRNFSMEALGGSLRGLNQGVQSALDPVFGLAIPSEKAQAYNQHRARERDLSARRGNYGDQVLGKSGFDAAALLATEGAPAALESLISQSPAVAGLLQASPKIAKLILDAAPSLTDALHQAAYVTATTPGDAGSRLNAGAIAGMLGPILSKSPGAAGSLGKRFEKGGTAVEGLPAEYSDMGVGGPPQLQRDMSADAPIETAQPSLVASIGLRKKGIQEGLYSEVDKVAPPVPLSGTMAEFNRQFDALGSTPGSNSIALQSLKKWGTDIKANLSENGTIPYDAAKSIEESIKKSAGNPEFLPGVAKADLGRLAKALRDDIQVGADSAGNVEHGLLGRHQPVGDYLRAGDAAWQREIAPFKNEYQDLVQKPTINRQVQGNRPYTEEVLWNPDKTTPDTFYQDAFANRTPMQTKNLYDRLPAQAKKAVNAEDVRVRVMPFLTEDTSGEVVNPRNIDYEGMYKALTNQDKTKQTGVRNHLDGPDKALRAALEEYTQKMATYQDRAKLGLPGKPLGSPLEAAIFKLMIGGIGKATLSSPMVRFYQSVAKMDPNSSLAGSMVQDLVKTAEGKALMKDADSMIGTWISRSQQQPEGATE